MLKLLNLECFERDLIPLKNVQDSYLQELLLYLFESVDCLINSVIEKTKIISKLCFFDAQIPVINLNQFYFLNKFLKGRRMKSKFIWRDWG